MKATLGNTKPKQELPKNTPFLAKSKDGLGWVVLLVTDHPDGTTIGKLAYTVVYSSDSGASPLGYSTDFWHKKDLEYFDDVITLSN